MRSSFVSSVFFFKSVQVMSNPNSAKPSHTPIDAFICSHLTVLICFTNMKKHPFILGDSIMLRKNHERMDRVFAQVTIQGVWSFCLGGRVEAQHCIRTYDR